ncbi:MAG: hypothetical protein ABSA52_19155 [Candidatus Binatia bacterium]|jgi:hypothetical protein
MNKTLSVLTTLLGVILVLLSIVYFLIPANSLPWFLPGHDPALTKLHLKHGWAALIIGAALLVLASRFWPKKRSEQIE